MAHLIPQDYQLVPLANLSTHPRNPRQGDLAAIRESIHENDFYGAVVVQRSTGYILVGNHRYLAAKDEGLTEIPVFYVDVDDDRATRILLADNRTSDAGGYDDLALAELLQEIANSDTGLRGTGYDDDALAALLESITQETLNQGHDVEDPDGGGDDFDATPEEGPTRTQVGVLWALGPHKLYVGSCTDADGVARLFGKERFRCMVTDPPYGVNHSGGAKDPRSATYRAGDKIANDNMTEGQTEQLVTEAFALAAKYGTAGASAYVAAPPGPLHRRFIDAMNNSGFQYRHGLVWVKDTFVFGRSDYHYRHEPILYGWLDNGPHYFVDDRTQSSVFEVDRPKRSEDHPTMKPVPLFALFTENSVPPGEIVYDPFMGSGTTLIAAHRTGRVARGCELSEKYADVILRRAEAEGLVVTLLSRKTEVAYAG